MRSNAMACNFKAHYQAVIESCSDMALICEPLNCLGIKVFSYVRVFKNGYRATLCNHAPISEFFLNISNTPRYKPGIEIEQSLNDQTVFNRQIIDGNELLNESVDRFQVDNTIALTEPHEHYCDYYYFTGEKDNSKIINVYLSNIDLLKRFIVYFKDIGSDLIAKADKFAFKIPSFDIRPINFNQELIPDIAEFKKEFIEHTPIKRYALNIDNRRVDLTQREVDCLEWLVIGKTAAETAAILAISQRTVETHVNRIKEKMDCYKISQIIQKCLQAGFIFKNL